MPRNHLDRAVVVAAAAELVNAEGAPALSLARLADHLGVRTPSLYNHIDGLAGLQRELERLNARRLGEAISTAVMGRAGMGAMHALVSAYRTYARENPGLYAVGQRSAVGDDPDRPGTAELQAEQERVVQAVLRVVESFGLTGADALHAVRGLRSLAHGFVSLELAGGFGLPLDLDESYRRTVEIFGRGIAGPGA